MIEFLSRNYFLIVYGIAWVFSVRYYGKYFDTVLRFFPIIIAYTFFSELLGYLIGTSDDFAFFAKFKSANDLIYNIYTLIFFPFFYFVYWKLVKNENYRSWIKILSVLALAFYLVNAFIYNPLVKVLFYALCFASFVLALCVVFYWLDKRSHWQWRTEKYNLMTWVSIGLFGFYSIFPIIFLLNFLNKDLYQILHLGTVHKIFIVLMYVLFSIGFVLSSRRNFH
ncbi:hypothetical protein ABV409_12510 [Flagellimonas sp. DF-77]|uniref:hypothetical protein n=1 Tax=Flagellimonas algarum TaxID=3230298 RepID=UPI003391F377